MTPGNAHHFRRPATAGLVTQPATGSPQHTWHHRLLAWALGLAALLMLLPGWATAQTGTWSSTTPMGTARAQHTATPLPSGKVLVAGGRNGNFLASAELYVPDTDTWSTTNPMGTVRYEHTATLLPSGKVLVVGGANSSLLASAELYDPATNTWSTTTNPMGTARYAHTATLLPSGKVLVAGGNSSRNGALSSTALYDPATNTWSSTNPMGTARHLHTATTLLPSGKVLVAGGVGSGYLASAELYDPDTNTWRTTNPMGIARHYHTATLLPSGKVLVAGGSNSSNSHLASAEPYDPGIPGVTAISPANGPTLGGIAVTITGINFTGASSATVCGEALVNWTVENATTITGATAAHVAASCDVVVTTPDGTATAPGRFSYVKSSQTLSFGAAPTLVYGGGAGVVNATSTGGATLDSLTTYSSTPSTICTVDSATGSVTPVAAGACTITADNPGNGDYSVATANLSFTIAQATQAITGFTATPETPVFAAGGTFTVAAAGGASGRVVTFDSISAGVCTVSGSTVRMVSAGVCELRANQLGNSNYDAASQATLNVTITKASQILTFGAASPSSYTLEPGTSFAINPLATSSHANANRPITYRSTTPTVCSVSRTQVTMLAGGTCTVQAGQTGDSNYLPAVQSQSVTLAAQTSFTGTTVPGAGGTAGTATASFTGGGVSCRFDTSSASTGFVAAPATLPAGQTMPQGMLQFKLVGCDAASTVTVAITWPQAVQGLTKFGKAAAGAASTHFAPNGLQVNGNTTTFTVKDGELGDDDWTPNGVIVDPVGATVPVAIAVNPTPVPTLGQWALVLLSLMAAAVGMGTLRRQGHSRI